MTLIKKILWLDNQLWVTYSDFFTFFCLKAAAVCNLEPSWHPNQGKLICVFLRNCYFLFKENYHYNSTSTLFFSSDLVLCIWTFICWKRTNLPTKPNINWLGKRFLFPDTIKMVTCWSAVDRDVASMLAPSSDTSTSWLPVTSPEVF